MSVKLTCPVCDRLEIETNICPNCETDLSTYRMLIELPVETLVEEKELKRNLLIWFPVGLAILFLLLGMGLGFFGNLVIARQQPQTTENSTIVSNTKSQNKSDELEVSPSTTKKPQKIEKFELKSCGGFNYVVRKGDSLSLISSRFYGNSNLWTLISRNNTQIQGRENYLEIGRVIFIPNLEANCQ